MPFFPISWPKWPLFLCLLIVTEASFGFTVSFRSPKEWQRVFFYSFQPSQPGLEPRGSFPGEELSLDDEYFTVDIKEDEKDPSGRAYFIFSNGGGAQTEDLQRDKRGYYILDSSLQGRWYDEPPEPDGYFVSVIGGEGAGLYKEGDQVTIEASPPGLNQVFASWQGTGSRYLSDPSKEKASFLMPEQALDFRATYQDFNAGALWYEEHQCASCHGSRGEGGVGPSLRHQDGMCGSCGSLESLTEAISQTMPKGNPHACAKEGSCALEVARYITHILASETENRCHTPKPKARQIRLLTRIEYENTLRAFFQDDSITAGENLPRPAKPSGFSNAAKEGIVSRLHLEVYIKDARRLAMAYDIKDLLPEDCKASSCVVATLGQRAFRRPLSPMELKDYKSLFEEKGGQATVLALLLSPHFIYRTELGQRNSKGIYQLTGYEVASLLSYTFQLSPPSLELLSQGRDGKLFDPAFRKAVIKDLILSKKGREALRHFALDWLQVNDLLQATRDDPELTDSIRKAMLSETADFFAYVARTDGTPFHTLFTGDFSFVQNELAQYYGFPPPIEGRVELEGEAYSGILSHGSLMATWAGHNEESPVKRGVFLRRELLCQSLPMPPPNVDVVIPTPKPGETMRERLKRHQESGSSDGGPSSCHACHQYIDSVGFGFDAFDETGRLAADHESRDVSGNLNDLEYLGSQSDALFANLSELGDHLAKARSPRNCFHKKFYRYLTGRLDSKDDQCSLNETAKGLSAYDAGLFEYLIQTTDYQRFTERQ